MVSQCLTGVRPAVVKSIPSILEVISTDGIKLVLDKSHWLMFRFSGTEPLLRIYCEAPSSAEVTSTLYYAKQLIDNSFG